MMKDMRTVYPQLSDWSTTESGIPKRQTSTIINIKKNNTLNNNLTDFRKRRSSINEKKKGLWKLCPCCTSIASFLLCFLTCCLVIGVILAVLLPVLLITLRTTSTAQTTNILTTILTTDTSVTTSTSNTTSTDTASTTISTSMTTSTTTAANICVGGYTYVTQLLYLDMASTLYWTQYVFNYTAPNVTSAKLTFSFRDDPSFWYLDDVSVTNSSGQQLLLNGGFEQGNVTNWTYCNPNNSSYFGTVSGSNPNSGLYCYMDGSIGAPDYLSQTFNVLPNNIYSVGFSLSATSTNMKFAWITISS